jgi:hypothetical protein
LNSVIRNLKEAGWVAPAMPYPPPPVPAVWFRSDAGARVARKLAMYALETLAEKSVAALVAAVI